MDKKARIMFKLTLPETAGFYSDIMEYDTVVRVLALSGGYSREVANEKLSMNKGLIASFSRALTEGLSVNQSEAEFDHMLDQSIQSIYDASIQ
jgi:fructose-bisphosphate aldolase class I